MKVWPVLGITFIQAILCLGHWLLFVTAVRSWHLGIPAQHQLGLALAVLSFSFIVAALLAYRFSGVLIQVLYTAASAWLGILNFLTWAACLYWLAMAPIHLFGLHLTIGGQTLSESTLQACIATALFAAAIILSLYGFANARRIRERHLSVDLPHLPETWAGRKALLLTDLHLGHINGATFARRIAGIARRLNPDVIFIAGDLYDGSRVDPAKLAAPLFSLNPPLGIYFCGGNHEEIGDETAYETAIRAGGIRVLNNELVEVDGVQVAGVRYADTTFPQRLRGILEKMRVDPNRPAILLNHVPNRLPLVEQAGFALQLSGHTHGGQIFPFTWVTRRAFGKFTRGLNRFGPLQVLTSMGVGTWGPPMRVGTASEVFLITFEQASGVQNTPSSAL